MEENEFCTTVVITKKDGEKWKQAVDRTNRLFDNPLFLFVLRYFGIRIKKINEGV